MWTKVTTKDIALCDTIISFLINPVADNNIISIVNDLYSNIQEGMNACLNTLN